MTHAGGDELSAMVLRIAGRDPIQLPSELEPGVNPMLVIDAMRNLAEEVRDIQRITRIVRFRVRQLELNARFGKHPENAARSQSRSDAYRVWLYHLELMTGDK